VLEEEKKSSQAGVGGKTLILFLLHLSLQLGIK
jgi:hypothetical protein